MALKYVDLYQKVFDAVSESFTKSYSPNERSAFPNQGLAVLVGKTPLHKEVEKGNITLYTLSFKKCIHVKRSKLRGEN